MESKNVFDETVSTLIEDAKKLQAKLSKFQESNNFSEALSCMRLLKDTLSLIKEYDWELKYSELESSTGKQIKIWEQNHCGEVRNLNTWNLNAIQNKIDSYNLWIAKFENAISKGESLLIEKIIEPNFRGSGKSYALAMLCDKYHGVVVSEHMHRYTSIGIENNCKQFGFKVDGVRYREAFLRQYHRSILFIDEMSGLTDEQIEKLKESHLVIGFK